VSLLITAGNLSTT